MADELDQPVETEAKGDGPGTPGEPQTIKAEMQAITQARESTQPVKSRTGGSTGDALTVRSRAYPIITP